MKSTIYKNLGIFIILATSLINLTGCNSNNRINASITAAKHSQQAKESQNELMKSTIKFILPGSEPEAQKEVTAAIEEKLSKDSLDFKLDFTYIPLDHYWNKILLIDASGESYDLVWVHSANISNIVAKKALQPLNEALDKYGQNIKKNTPEYAFKQVTINGNIYGIPRIMPISEYERFIQIREDLRKKYGIPEIKTVSDLDKYFEAIAKNEPGIIPYYYDSGRFLLREYGDVAFIAGDFLNSPVYIDPADPDLKVRNTYESEIFKNILQKMREWKGKGYFQNNNPSIPDAEQALRDGKIGATWSFVMKQTERIDDFKASTPNGELENVYLHPEKSSYLFTAADNVLSVFSTSKHVNEAVAFINWARSSQENYDLFSYGIKDVNYKLDGNSISYDGIERKHTYMPDSWAWNDIKYVRFSKYLSPDYVETLRNWDKGVIESPTLGFVPDLSPVKTEMTQLDPVIAEYVTKLYDPATDWDSTMDKFKKKLKDCGINNVINEMQKQFDSFRANKH